jgi:transposase
MSKNNMRTPEEKEKILKEFYLGNLGRNEICRKYNISTRTLADWRIKYEESGIDGLKSNTGKSKGGNKGLGLKKGKTNEEKLKLKIMKLEIENARLKKGYLVKGGGDQKEYVTTLDENTK